MTLPLGDLGGHLPRRLEQAREAAFLLRQDPLLALHALDIRERLLDFGPQHGDLRSHRQQLVLHRIDAFQFVLRIADECANGIDLRFDGIDLGATRELIAELALDIGHHAIETVDAPFDLLDELQPGCHAVDCASSSLATR